METKTMTEPIQSVPLSAQQTAQLLGRVRLESQARSGANNFFWIAVLSLVNSVIYLTGGHWTFFIGLGATQFIDGMAKALANDAPSSGIVFRVIGLGIDALVIGLFVLFGVLSRRRKGWAFIVGMVVYALDGLIFLLVSDFVGLGLHVFFLYLLIQGYMSLRRLYAVESGTLTLPITTTFAQRARTRGYWIRLLFFPAIMLTMLLFVLVYVFLQSH